MSGAGFFDDDDDDASPSFVDRSTSSGPQDLFSEASPRAYNRPAAAGAGRVSSTTGDRTSSSVRASSVASRDGEPEDASLEAMTGVEPSGPKEPKERNLQLLIRCWSNEIGAPEVLPFPRELVERVVKDLATRREKVMEQGVRQGQKEGFYTELALVATENLRASHVLRAYTRERIYKIEKFARYYLAPDMQEETEWRLYHNEIQHARGYVEITDEYFRSAAVNDMPNQVAKNLDGPDLFPAPDFSQAVLVRARRDCPAVVFPDGNTMRFKKDSQHLTRYSTIRELLMHDYVELL